MSDRLASCLLALACVLSAACDPLSSPDASAPGGGKLDDPDAVDPPAVWSIGGNGGGHAAWSPDGTRIATAGPTVQILEAARGHVLASFDDGSAKRGVAWSPDGKQLATGEDGGKLALRDSGNGTIGKLLDAGTTVYSVAWSANGARVAVGGLSSIRVWDAGTGAVINTFSTSSQVLRLSLTPDGERVITSLGEGEVEVIEVADATRLISTASPCAQLGGDCAAYNPAFDVFAVATVHALEIFDAVTGTQVRTIGASPDPITSVEWTDDTHLRMLSDSALRSINFETEAVTSVALRAGRYIDFEQSAASGAVLLYGGQFAERQVIDVMWGTLVEPLNHHGRIVDVLGFDATGELFASLTVDPHDPVQIRRDDALFVHGMRQEFVHGNPLSLAWRPGDDVVRTLATAGFEVTELFFFDGTAIDDDKVLDQGSELAEIAWSHDGTWLATVGDKIKLWDASGNLKGTMGTLFARYLHVTWGDGDLFAASTISGKIEIWNASSGTKVKTIASGPVFELAWRGDLLVTLGNDSGTGDSFKAWDTATGELVYQSAGLDIGPHALAWHPDGDRVAVAGNTGAVAIWDVAGRAFVDQFTAHVAFVEAIAWHPAGDRLLTAGGGDGRITMWSFGEPE